MDRYRHSMDTVFAWLLFAMFAALSVLLVLLGARIYAKSASDLNAVDTPVILSYLTEKMRGCRELEEIRIQEGNCLVLPADTPEGGYVTWIYVEDGCLKEALMPLGREPVAGAGSVIAQVQEFELKELENGLLRFQVVDQTGSEGYRYYAISSQGQAAET